MKWITDNNPIRNINTVEVRLSEKEIKEVFRSGLINAFKQSSDTCYTKLLLSLENALKDALNKPRINK